MDTNNRVRIVVAAGVGEIPAVGVVIAALVEILWPESKEDIWGQIKDEVEALIDKKLADFKYQQVKETLEGLGNVLNGYTQALKHSKSNPTFISDAYNGALRHFKESKPHFKSKEYEVLLLPLLAHMANLHIALLRDGANFGSTWDWTPDIVSDMKIELTDAIKEYGDWVNQWYQKGYEQVDIPQKYTRVSGNWDNLSTLQWSARNKYARGMTLQVQDIAFYWPYFDDAKHNSGSAPKLTREIYSDPQATAFGNHPINIDTSVKQRLTNLSIWGWDHIDAVQQAFGGGPLGPRMGNERKPMGSGWFGGNNAPPHGWNGEILTNNPVVEVSGIAGDGVDAMSLKFKDGTETNKCGAARFPPGPPNFTLSFDGEILSQIYINGPIQSTGTAECVIFGFRFEDSY